MQLRACENDEVSRLIIRHVWFVVTLCVAAGCAEAENVHIPPEDRKAVEETGIVTECTSPVLGDAYPPQISAQSEDYLGCLKSVARRAVKKALSAYMDYACIEMNNWGELGRVESCENTKARGEYFPSEETEALEMAESVLGALNTLVGVENIEDLSVVTSRADRVQDDDDCLENCSWHIEAYRFEFGPQKYSGLTVEGSDLSMQITKNYVISIRSSWRADLNIPIIPRVSADLARQVLIEHEILESPIYVPLSEIGDGELVVKRVANFGYFDPLAYHLAWQFQMNDGFWTGYIDAVNGQLIEITQNVIIEEWASEPDFFASFSPFE